MISGFNNFTGQSRTSTVSSRKFARASFFDSHTAKRQTCSRDWIDFGEREIRSGGSFGALSIFINQSSSEANAGWCGKSEAVCPSGPIPKKAISMFPTLSLYSVPSLFIIGRKNSGNQPYLFIHGRKNVFQICSSFRSERSQFTRSSVTHQRIFSNLQSSIFNLQSRSIYL